MRIKSKQGGQDLEMRLIMSSTQLPHAGDQIENCISYITNLTFSEPASNFHILFKTIGSRSIAKISVH